MKILLSTIGFYGHVLPASAFVEALVTAGHQVTWHTTEPHRATVESSGAAFEPVTRSRTFDDYKPLPLDACIEEFKANGDALKNDIHLLLLKTGADLCIADRVSFGAQAAADLRGIPFVELGLLPLVAPDPSVPLILQGSFSMCEAPWPQAKNIHFCGPLIPKPRKWIAPDWYRTLDPTKPWIMVTQGTLDDRPYLITTAADALADADVETLVSWPHDLKLPKNAHRADWISLADVLPRCAAVVTNGGYATVTECWARGVPMVVAGTTEDKAVVADRVDRVSGTGIDLGTRYPTPAAVKRALAAVTNYPRYYNACQGLAQLAARHPTPQYMVHVLEQFYASLPPRSIRHAS